MKYLISLVLFLTSCNPIAIDITYYDGKNEVVGKTRVIVGNYQPGITFREPDYKKVMY